MLWWGMAFLQENDKSRAVCEYCGLVSTTFLHRLVTMGNAGAIHVLAGVCDNCARVVSIPAQSTPEIKMALTQAKSTEGRFIPRQEIRKLRQIRPS